LSGWEYGAVGAAIAIVAVCGLLKLPPGVCFGDSGDLQAAAATLGIMHPPGYPGYVSLGYLATLVPGVEPARAVSMLFFLAVPVTVGLLVLTQIRLGVDAWLAAAVGLGFLLHRRVAVGVSAPEVYWPSLGLCAGAVYGLIRFGQGGSRGWVYGAVLAYGVVIANRLPAALFGPGLVVALVLAVRARRAVPTISDELSAGADCEGKGFGSGTDLRGGAVRRRNAMAKRVALGVVLLVGPLVYSVGYVLVRDKPGTYYNYLEHYNREYGSLPQVADGFGGRVERAWWLLSGRQFASSLRLDGRGIVNRLRALMGVVSTDRVVRWVGGLWVVVGVVMCWRRNRTGCVGACSLGVGAIGYYCVYRVSGQAADVLGLFYALAVFGGVAGSVIAPRRAFGGRVGRGVGGRWIGACAFVVVGICFAPVIGTRTGWNADAKRFVERAGLDALPQDSVILAPWDAGTPLVYAISQLEGRGDIDVVIAMPGSWRELVGEMGDRPVFATRRIEPAGTVGWVRHGSLWRWEQNVTRAGAGRKTTTRMR